VLDTDTLPAELVQDEPRPPLVVVVEEDELLELLEDELLELVEEVVLEPPLVVGA
jgi:predicted house-cleaning noncanonical NTP pyrophosphatase (MazG superfamily)